MLNGVTEKSVFVSYSHRDKAACTDLVTNLMAQGVRVVYDDTSLQTGDDLTQTLHKYISDTDFTICLLSECSIQSPWVLWEIKQALDKQGQQADKKFLPAYLDKSFQDDNKIKDIVNSSERRISELDHAIKNELDNKRGIDHLTTERARLLKVQQEFPSIINFLNNVLITDLQPFRYEDGFKQLCECITGSTQLLQPLISRGQTDNTDFFSRRETVLDLIMLDELPEAVNQCMDLIKQFFPGNGKLLSQICLLSAGIRRSKNEYNQNKQANEEKIVDLQKHYEDKMDQYAANLMELVPDDFSSVA